MDLQLTNKRFIICGASSGFGEAISRLLLTEGAHLILVARRGHVLEEKFDHFYDQVTFIEGSILHQKTLQKIRKSAARDVLHGMVLNAGGPPVGTPLETHMDDWDAAWKLVMRWKIELTKMVAPQLAENKFGRILFIESQSVKQPLPSLALSNAFRAGITGYAKSLANELAPKGVTVNVLAPGSHETPAIERVINNKSKKEDISYDVAKSGLEQNIPVGRMGKAEELASLAAWLLSGHAGYVTGQTISHDGGSISGLFG